MTVAGPPRRIGRTQLIVGTIVMVLAVAGVGVVHRLLSADGRRAVAAVLDGVARDPDEPRLGLPDRGRLPAGAAVPVFVGRFALTELACRSRPDPAPAVQPPVTQEPVVAGRVDGRSAHRRPARVRRRGSPFSWSGSAPAARSWRSTARSGCSGPHPNPATDHSGRSAVRRGSRRGCPAPSRVAGR